MKRRLGLLVLIGAVSLLGGAAVLAVAPPADDGLGPVTRALGLARGPELDARRAAAVAEATGRCLARYGVIASPVPEPAPSIPDAELGPVAWAERWGFGVTTSVGWPATLVSGSAIPPSPVAAACESAAADAVYGLRDRLLTPLRPALERLGAAIDADPATRAADASWVVCATSATVDADRGLPAPRMPGELRDVRAWFAARAGAAPDPSLVELERRVAAAIARCDGTRIAARRRAAEPHERSFVAAHAGELATIGAAIRAAEAADPSSAP